MAAPGVSKAEYLQRYLSGPAAPAQPRRRRKKRPPGSTGRAGMRIVDDDVSWNSIAAAPQKEEEEDDEADMPVVAEFIDERPDEVKLMEEFRTNSKWKLLGDQNEDSQSSDISGPAKSATRQQRHDSPDPSPPRGEHNGSLDPSAPRRQRHDTPDPSPPRRKRHDTPDPSPPRRKRHDTPDPSPPRRKRHDTPDPSPPRKQRHDTPDPSPPRRKRHDTPDPSPPRKQRHDTPDLSPPRRRQRQDTPDPSPPRRRRRDTPDPSPPRRQRHDTPDSSPPRKQRCDTPDLSPPRRRRHDTPELSPARKQRHDTPDPSPRRDKPSSPSLRKSRTKGRSSPAGKGQHRSRSPPDHSPHRQDTRGSPRKANTMSSGVRAGLVSAEVLQKEKQELQKPDKSMKHLEEESRNAKTVFRDKSGRKRNLAQEQLEQRLKAEAEAKREEQYAKWGKGLAQERQQQQNVEDAIKEMQKPLARYIDDQDLDRMLREQEREGDPMAALIKKRKAKENKEKEKPRYKGPAPPLNRFNIWPGHRWDGVDRSNGFEQQRFARIANKKAVQELAYKWSVEDM
ncbi:BUD13 homolog isoform X8 [Manacus candei]|uniref:BUD13 homolog isoform X8 n=1 Tax=Manacus candei TaxID=415023 RepID=UPI002226591F|nr:BUD13 homolog isoform X8 [Manacus candei]